MYSLQDQSIVPLSSLIIGHPELHFLDVCLDINN